jgi:hypothetical protein
LPRASADAAAASVQATKPRIIAPLMRVRDAAL